MLIQQQQAMGIATIIDQIIRPNGNRQGLSVGWTVVGWISFILSESDHRSVVGQASYQRISKMPVKLHTTP